MPQEPPLYAGLAQQRQHLFCKQAEQSHDGASPSPGPTLPMSLVDNVALVWWDLVGLYTLRRNTAFYLEGAYSFHRLQPKP